MSMAVFRLPLCFEKEIVFFRLMGSGKGGGFGLEPDLGQWAMLTVHNVAKDCSQQLKIPKFINTWARIAHCECFSISLQPFEGHGTWGGRWPFGEVTPITNWDKPICILTRATIRLAALKAFWGNVPQVSRIFESAQGLLLSFGVGEAPFVMQATISIWENVSAMKQFAYKKKEHINVIEKSKSEKWYSEEMFVRFYVLGTEGTIRGESPLKDYFMADNSGSNT